MKDRDSFRGTFINETFGKLFQKSRFYTHIYNKHRNELIIGVRDSYINIYYNCDSIAKIEVNNPDKCVIDSYYTNGKSTLSDNEMVQCYETIKEKSDNRKKYEKQAQQKLFIDNNNNPSSDWFCIDVEYTKSLKGKEKPENWRFDIIAISKLPPFRVALIELKYGSGAMKEPSGIRTHVKDFYSFYKNNKFEMLKLEIISIINGLSYLGVNVPTSLKDISCEDIAQEPEFYFITLNNNPDPEHPSSDNTPKKTMSGYLFSDKRWGCKRVSSLVNKDGDYFDIIEHSKSFKPVFLFSNSKLPNLQIQDILNKESYDVEKIEK